MDPEAAEHRSAVILAVVNQAAPDIRKKLQKTDGLAGKSVNDLMGVANKVQARLRMEENETGEG